MAVVVFQLFNGMLLDDVLWRSKDTMLTASNHPDALENAPNRASGRPPTVASMPVSADSGPAELAGMSGSDCGSRATASGVAIAGAPELTAQVSSTPVMLTLASPSTLNRDLAHSLDVSDSWQRHLTCRSGPNVVLDQKDVLGCTAGRWMTSSALDLAAALFDDAFGADSNTSLFLGPSRLDMLANCQVAINNRRAAAVHPHFELMKPVLEHVLAVAHVNGNHWCLLDAMVDNGTVRTVRVFDGMRSVGDAHGGHRGIALALANGVNAVLRLPACVDQGADQPQTQITVAYADCAPQLNAYDCGPLALLFGKQIMQFSLCNRTELTVECLELRNQLLATFTR